jgi:radical SAM superfamily enzyme YgiQ (UPF0313 family)
VISRRVLLVSTYELGHQPWHLARAAGALRRAGHRVDTIDLSLEELSPELVERADVLGVSVPMHTATRLALDVVARVRVARPEMPVCLFGLYAHLATGAVDHVVSQDEEAGLVAWVGGGEIGAVSRHGAALVPDRTGLPGLERYAHLALGGEERRVGHVQASTGCRSQCRHCPVPIVHHGRSRIVDADSIRADADQLVAAGAGHLTFGDPDFLNHPHHSLRVVRALHERHPDLTFDITTKVELILRHEGLWPELAAAGCLFVVSAFESVNDNILARLDKGHTAADAARATWLLRSHGIEVRPSLLPFTPWTTLEDMIDLVEYVARHDLTGNVEPVQFTVRLLLPEGSLLLGDADLRARLGPYDRSRLSYPWVSLDPAVDALQSRLAALVEERAAAGLGGEAMFAEIAASVGDAAGRAPDVDIGGLALTGASRPRLTEPWFC